MGSVVVITSPRASKGIDASAPTKPLLSLRVLGLSVLLLATTLLFAGLVSSCRTADPTGSNTNEQPLVHTTIAGTVVDEAGLPVMGATVSAHGQSATTDKLGYFVLQNVSAPKDRFVAMAKLDGYFTAANAGAPKENGLTETKLFLMSHGIRKSVNASTGGTISVSSTSGSASVKLDPDGLVTSSGAAFTGVAQVAVRHLDPADPTFAYYFAGDQAAIRENGDQASLVSYGVLRVDLRSSNGEQLQPAAGKPAQISYPIPVSMQATAPATMPLWFFDEQKGLWVEEGLATKQGNNYVGTVKHFTDWNCDHPSENNATLTGIVHCNGVPMSGVVVRIGQLMAYTDLNGRFTRFVPIGIDFNVVVDPSANAGLFASAPMNVPALTSRETRDITIPLTSECPSTLSGTLTDEQDKPIAGHVAWVNESGRVAAVSTLDGVFHIRVNGNSSISLEASSWVCTGSKTFAVTSGTGGGDVNIGNLKVCGADVPTVGDIDISAFDSLVYATLSPDGSKIAISGDAPVVVVRSAIDGTLISSANLGGSVYHYTSPADFSGDGSRFSMDDQSSQPPAGVWETSTGNRLASIQLTTTHLMPDGNSIVGIAGYSGQTNYYLARYDVATGQEIQKYSLDLKSIGYSALAGISDGGKIAIIFAGSKVIRFDLANDVTISNSPIAITEFRWYGPIGMSADGSRIAVTAWVSGQYVTAIVNTETGALVNSFPSMGFYGNGSTAISPDGSVVILQSMTKDGVFLAPVLVDVNTGSEIQSLTTDGAPGLFVHFSFSANGKKLVGVYKKDNKTMLRIWDL